MCVCAPKHVRACGDFFHCCCAPSLLLPAVALPFGARTMALRANWLSMAGRARERKRTGNEEQKKRRREGGARGVRTTPVPACATLVSEGTVKCG